MSAMQRPNRLVPFLKSGDLGPSSATQSPSHKAWIDVGQMLILKIHKKPDRPRAPDAIQRHNSSQRSLWVMDEN